MTVTVNFEAPQLKVGNGTTGIEISQVVLPYSIRNNEDASQYLGGQTILTKEDVLALSDNTSDWYKKALAKIKNMVAVSEIYTPDVTPTTQETITPDVAQVAQATTTPDVTQTTQEVATPETVPTAQVQ